MTYQYGPEEEEDARAHNDDWLDPVGEEDEEDEEEIDFSGEE